MQKELPRAEFADALCAKADAQGYADIRRELVRDLPGRVLEVGCGTGAMFAYYGSDTEIDAIEPEEDFLSLAVSKAEKSSSGKVRARHGDGMRLDFPEATFDAVVFSLVLCSVPSVERVLAEAFRVLRHGGKLRALEHVSSEGLIGHPLMNVTNPLWLMLNKQGCNWNRNPLEQMGRTGFRIDDVRPFQRFDTLMPAFPMRLIRAHKP